ncbi:MAG: AAA family ATPase [Dysgonomonas sp.]
MAIAIDTSNKEFNHALELINRTRQSVFLTGKAGTGKSTFLKYLCDTTQKKHIVLAPTGIAAINAGGSTLHSFFKLPFRPMLPDDPDLNLSGGRIFDFFKYKKEHRKIIEQVELIIIDEISMVRADTVDCIDRILRVYSGNMRQPFGGKQVVFVGDIFQLEPVVTSDSKEIIGKFYNNAFFFSANVFREIGLIPIEFTKIYRQSDKAFISVLNNIRKGNIVASDLQLLNTRYNPTFNPSDSDMYITLATRRDTVDYINEKKMNELKTPPFINYGVIEGDFPESSLPTSKDLLLKEGAQVMFIHNDAQWPRRWVNGTLGIVSQIDDMENVFVLLENGKEVQVELETWRNYRYRYNEKEKKIEEEIIGTYTQLPLKAAWAITIHKSQGLTFNNVIIDFSGGVFAGGQAYVALSRCCSLEGLVLRKNIMRADIFVRPEIIEFSRQFNNEQLINKALKESDADYLYFESVKAFDDGDFEKSLEVFFKAIRARYDIEKPLSKRYIRRKLNKINILKAEVRELRNKLHEQTDSLKKYAKEYYLLGNECVTSYKDYRAAIANFNKALELDPAYVDAWVRKGVTLHDMNEYYDADICFNKAIKLSPLSFKALYNRGKNRIAMNESELALTDLLKAAGLKPEHASLHEYIAQAYTLSGNEEEAEKHNLIAEELRHRKKK